jgi:hypothetical protein
VKCPKCDEPFVIPKPKKKRHKIKPEVDFFEDDSNSSTDMYEDDFESWDDDLSSGPSIKPKEKKKKTAAKKEQKQSSFSLQDYGLSPFITGTSLFLILLNLVLYFMQSQFLLLACFLTFIVGIGCLLVGGIGLLIETGKESGGEVLLCLLLPFYNLYFGISRFEQTKHAVATFVTGASLMFIVCMLTFGFVSNLMLRRNNNVTHTPPPANSTPDLNSTFENNRKSIRSNSNAHTHTPNRTQPNSSSQKSTQDSEAKRSQLTKFDLSQIKPMLMAWPTEGVSGSKVYYERKTASIGKVFEVVNTSSFEGETPAAGQMKFRVYLPPNADPASPVPCILVPPAVSNLLTGMEIDPPDLIHNPEHEPYVKVGFAVVTFSLDGALHRREQSTNIEVIMAHKEFKTVKRDW